MMPKANAKAIFQTEATDTMPESRCPHLAQKGDLQVSSGFICCTCRINDGTFVMPKHQLLQMVMAFFLAHKDLRGRFFDDSIPT